MFWAYLIPDNIVQDKKKLAEAERAAKEAQEIAELRKTMVFKVWVWQLGMQHAV